MEGQKGLGTCMGKLRDIVKNFFQGQFMWDALAHSYPNFRDGLVVGLGYRWIIKYSYRFHRIIHALIPMLVKLNVVSMIGPRTRGKYQFDITIATKKIHDNNLTSTLSREI